MEFLKKYSSGRVYNLFAHAESFNRHKPPVLRRLPESESLHVLGRDPVIYVLIKHFRRLLFTCLRHRYLCAYKALFWRFC